MHNYSIRKYRLSDYKGIMFVLPALAFYITFVILPIFGTLRFSFYDWDGANPVMKFIGLQNYADLLKDEIFWKALVHNIIWIVASIILPVVTGMILAVMISSKEIKVKMIFRITYFLPAVLSLAIVSYIWDWMYNPTYGVVNTILKGLGLDFLTGAWLGDEKLVLPSLIMAGSWTYFGFCMVVFMAAIQTISVEYFEVALIEGANRFQTLIHVTIPSIRNVVTLMVLNSLIGSFKVFDIVYLLTKGGPYNSSEVIATYMFSNTFILYKVGYGAAISMTLAVIIAVCSVIYMRYRERKD